MTAGNPPPFPLRAVIYTRVSSDRDGAGRSVGEQEAACREDCERNGWTVADVLTDNDRSATRWARQDRPAYDRLAEVLRGGDVAVLVTWEASRAQRDLTAYSQLRDLCAEHGVRWCYSGRIYDLTDDDDRFSTGIDALVAEREAGLTRKRILRSVEARAAAGRPHGQVPDGYKIEYDPDTGRPLRRVIDPDRAPIIREIVDRLLAGESAYAVASDLNDRGLRTRTGKPWRGGNLVRRVRSPTLAGMRVHRGEVLEVAATWPAIITPDEHHRLVALLSDPSRRHNKEGNAVRWLGSGIYRCGVCGARVRMISGYRPNGTRRIRYACPAGGCVMRGAEHTDAVVSAVAVAFLSRPDVAEQLRPDDSDAEATAAAARAAELRAELAKARELHRAGRLSLDSLSHMEGWALPEIDRCEARARPRHVPGIVFDVAGPDAAARWEATPVAAQRVIVKALFDVRVLPMGQRVNQHTPPDPTKIVVTRRRAGEPDDDAGRDAPTG